MFDEGEAERVAATNSIRRHVARKGASEAE
jgi:hypothetical protein